MMICPELYVQNLKDAGYPELIRERDSLLQSIREFEEKETAGDRSGDEWRLCPQPDVRYQMDLEYLAALCSYMSEKYSEDYVWGKRTLKEDAEQTKT